MNIILETRNIIGIVLLVAYTNFLQFLVHKGFWFKSSPWREEMEFTEPYFYIYLFVAMASWYLNMARRGESMKEIMSVHLLPLIVFGVMWLVAETNFSLTILIFLPILIIYFKYLDLV